MKQAPVVITNNDSSTDGCLFIEDDEHSESNDRPWNPGWYALSSEAKCTVNQVIEGILDAESTQFLRLRKRQPVAIAKFRLQVEAIVCDLILRDLESDDGWLSLSLSHDKLNHRADRYVPDVMGKTIPDLIERMHSLDYLEFDKGFRSPFQPASSRQSTIRMGQRLWKIAHKQKLDFKDFGKHLTDESIVLKARKKDMFDKGLWIQYEDTDSTNNMRDQMEAINSWIDAADIEYDGRHGSVNSGNRFLRRYFNNGSFEQGGRLFGGFWQQLSKTQRREGLSIEGGSTITLDYGQMVPRIMYGLLGVDLSLCDAYAIPGLEEYRDGVKKVFNSMLHSEKPLQMKPKGTYKLLPKDMTIEEITAKISEHHSQVASFFYAGRGLYLTYLESEILIRVLLELIRLNVVALPIHDAVIVHEDDEDVTGYVMSSVFEDMTGATALVNVEE